MRVIILKNKDDRRTGNLPNSSELRFVIHTWVCVRVRAGEYAYQSKMKDRLTKMYISCWVTLCISISDWILENLYIARINEIF